MIIVSNGNKEELGIIYQLLGGNYLSYLFVLGTERDAFDPPLESDPDVWTDSFYEAYIFSSVADALKTLRFCEFFTKRMGCGRDLPRGKPFLRSQGRLSSVPFDLSEVSLTHSYNGMFYVCLRDRKHPVFLGFV